MPNFQWSRSIFHEHTKSDPNFINKSLEGYRLKKTQEKEKLAMQDTITESTKYSADRYSANDYNFD